MHKYHIVYQTSKETDHHRSLAMPIRCTCKGAGESFCRSFLHKLVHPASHTHMCPRLPGAAMLSSWMRYLVEVKRGVYDYVRRTSSIASSRIDRPHKRSRSSLSMYLSIYVSIYLSICLELVVYYLRLALFRGTCSTKLAYRTTADQAIVSSTLLVTAFTASSSRA
jgi:hypothetical protein